MAKTKEKLEKSTRRVRGGTLFVVSALLFASAVLRIGLEAGPVLAREAVAADQDAKREVMHKDSAAPIPEDLHELLQALQKRESAIKQKEQQIEDRMKALEIADEVIERKMAALVAAEEALSSTLALADGATEDDLARLTAMYEKMKPKEAAALFEEMEAKFAAGFLSRMRSDVAAGIMAKLSPQAAYTISVVLAGRNSSVPKN